MKIEKYTFGIGDRFAHQGRAQLQALFKARDLGIDVHPVWNKSNREHMIIHSKPDDVRAEADSAVAALGWKGAYHVDADHIGLKTVDGFIPGSDFFTLDVADFTGKPATDDHVHAFSKAVRRYTGSLAIPGIDRPFHLTEETVRGAANKFLLAVQEAGRIFRHIEERKGRESFVTEVSVDETDAPQNPVELFLILAMIAGEDIPVQTIAPKFTGRFNKGVDYVGDLTQFEKEFDEDLSVIAFAIREFGLADTLKLSVHSGSDKFSIYSIINRLIKKHDSGLHVKTAGTTWLEEVIGLAESGGEGLALVKEVYAQAREHFEELAAPYSTVIDIDPGKLPDPKSVMSWSSTQYADALRHVESSPHYNPHFRQLLHVGFKVAAGMGKRFTDALEANEQIVGRNVTENLFDRHLRPIFG
ncbi:MAG TPA: tagaturonate epimerase family protein [Chthoniobacterales bacterium]|nr:tagaturonate epimerase family protein [Chthoniobacterales bacterium]